MTPETKAIIEKEAHQFASSILGIPPRSIGDDDTIVTGYIAGATAWADVMEEFAQWLDEQRNGNTRVWRDMKIWGHEIAFQETFKIFISQSVAKF